MSIKLAIVTPAVDPNPKPNPSSLKMTKHSASIKLVIVTPAVDPNPNPSSLKMTRHLCVY